MARTPTFDERDVLDAAIETFWELGYEATSVEDLTQRTGLARSSLYNSFGSKDELFTAALERYVEQQVGARLGELEDGVEGAAAIRRFFAAIGDDDASGRTILGCLAANTIAELGLRGDVQRPVLDAYRTRIGTAFATALSRAEEAGEIDDGDRALRARTLSTMAIGLFLVVRGNPDGPREAREVARTVEMLLRDWAPR